MNIQDAQEENQKAWLPEDKTSKPDEFVRCVGGVRYWYNTKDEQIAPVAYCLLKKDNWVPYPEQKIIRPEKAGELWKNEQGKVLVTLTTPEEEGLQFTYVSDAYKPCLLSDMIWHNKIIHNQNGWIHLYSPDESEIVIEDGLFDLINGANEATKRAFQMGKDHPDGINKVDTSLLFINKKLGKAIRLMKNRNI